MTCLAHRISARSEVRRSIKCPLQPQAALALLPVYQDPWGQGRRRRVVQGAWGRWVCHYRGGRTSSGAAAPPRTVTHAASVPALLNSSAKNDQFNALWDDVGGGSVDMQNAAFDLDSFLNSSGFGGSSSGTTSGSNNIFLQRMGGGAAVPPASPSTFASDFFENSTSSFLSKLPSTSNSSNLPRIDEALQESNSALITGNLEDVMDLTKDDKQQSSIDAAEDTRKPSPALSSSSEAADGTANAQAKMRMAAMDMTSLLHNSCKLYPDTVSVVESALRMDPGAVRRPISIVCNKNTSQAEEHRQKRLIGKRRVLERYSYPFNIALKYQANLDILKLLAKEGPEVLAHQDGPDQTSSLGTALTLDRGMEAVALILRICPKSAQTVDRHANFPLHIAVRRAHIFSSDDDDNHKAAVDVITQVYNAYPQALKKPNFHRETPLDVAIRSVFCPEPVVDFLQRHMHADGREEQEQMDDLTST